MVDVIPESRHRRPRRSHRPAARDPRPRRGQPRRARAQRRRPGRSRVPLPLPLRPAGQRLRGRAARVLPSPPPARAGGPPPDHHRRPRHRRGRRRRLRVQRGLHPRLHPGVRREPVRAPALTERSRPPRRERGPLPPTRRPAAAACHEELRHGRRHPHARPPPLARRRDRRPDGRRHRRRLDQPIELSVEGIDDARPCAASPTGWSASSRCGSTPSTAPPRCQPRRPHGDRPAGPPRRGRPAVPLARRAAARGGRADETSSTPSASRRRPSPTAGWSPTC